MNFIYLVPQRKSIEDKICTAGTPSRAHARRTGRIMAGKELAPAIVTTQERNASWATGTIARSESYNRAHFTEG
jgi:hypothetical protein